MPKIQNLIAIFLILGIVYAEFLPTMQAEVKQTAYSQAELVPNQSELLLDFFKTDEIAIQQKPRSEPIVTELNKMSSDISNLLKDFSNSFEVIEQENILTESYQSKLTEQVPLEDQFAIKDILPPANSPLFYAYTNSGKAWYTEDNQVIVIFPDESFRSFNTSTGEEISWLQDRIAYEPISSPNALEKYLDNYSGEIVAQTQTWVLVKFPSGGFLKIAKETELGTGPFLTQ